MPSSCACPGAVALELPVAKDLLHSQVGGHAADPAAGMACRAGLVQPVNRRPEVCVARSGPHVKQLVDGELAMEDVAADQPQLLFHVVWPDHLAVEDGPLQVWRQLRVAVDHAI